MGDEHDRPSLLLQAGELVEALLLKGGVPDREHLVDQDDLGLDLDRDREGEPYLHARGVVLELQIHELLELREGHDLVEAPLGLLARQAEHDRVDDHVVARRELRVEPHAELDERRQPAVDLDLSAIGLVDACEAFQQRALAAPVSSDDPEELTGGDLDADILNRVKNARAARPERVQHPLLERVGPLAGQAEALAHARKRDRHGRARSPPSGGQTKNRQGPRPRPTRSGDRQVRPAAPSRGLCDTYALMTTHRLDYGVQICGIATIGPAVMLRYSSPSRRAIRRQRRELLALGVGHRRRRKGAGGGPSAADVPVRPISLRSFTPPSRQAGRSAQRRLAGGCGVRDQSPGLQP